MCCEHSWSLKLHRNVPAQQCNLYFQGENFRGNIDWIIFSSSRGIIGTLSGIIYPVALRIFLIFPNLLRIRDESFENTFAFAKSLLSTEKYCRFGSDLNSFVYISAFRNSIERREAIAVFLFNKFSFNKSFNKHIKVPWRCSSSPLLFIMNPSSPSVNTRGQLSRPVIPGLGERWKMPVVSKEYSMMC